MKKIYLFTLLLGLRIATIAQQNYSDFEGIKVISFGDYSGTADSMFANPSSDIVNGTPHCARYIRSGATYDYLKLFPRARLADVTPYASNATQAPKFKMKIYSTAPAGTTVLLQLGVRNVDSYPAGIHSEYLAVTKTQNAWETLTFNYFQSPSGSVASPAEIDKVVLLFHPNSSNQEIYYFDDLMGAPLLQTGIAASGIGIAPPAFKLYQNHPNPVKETTRINFQLNVPGQVSLKIYDFLGNMVSSLVNQPLSTGAYSIPVETEDLPDGIYFYVLQKEDISQTLKMTVSK